jgi:DNA-binding LytR/AlgR family response regulator
MRTLKVPGFHKPIPIDLIIWFEGDDNYSKMHLLGNKTYLVSKTLKWFEERLEPFIRIHKSALINPAHVVASKRGLAVKQVTLRDGSSPPVSRRLRKTLADKLEALR